MHIRLLLDPNHSFSSDEEFHAFLNEHESLTIESDHSHEIPEERSVELITALIGAGAQIFAAFITAYFAFKKSNQKKHNITNTTVVILNREQKIIELNEAMVEGMTESSADQIYKIIKDEEEIKIQ